MKRTIIAAAVLAVAIGAGILASSWWRSSPSDAPPAFAGEVRPFETHERPLPAPDIRFTDAEGRTLDLSDFRGKVVLVNLWATWCVPCVKEMPALDRLQAALGGDGFEVVAISSDLHGLEAVEPFYAAHGLEHLAIYTDPRGSVARAFGAPGLPTSILLDARGREVGRLIGDAEWDSRAARALIRHYQ